jgi:hypothetical protein
LRDISAPVEHTNNLYPTGRTAVKDHVGSNGETADAWRDFLALASTFRPVPDPFARLSNSYQHGRGGAWTVSGDVRPDLLQVAYGLSSEGVLAQLAVFLER